MLGVTDFRWFNDKIVRDAREAVRVASEDLEDYGCHQIETHPRGRQETPEYSRLNEITCDARQALKDARP